MRKRTWGIGLMLVTVLMAGCGNSETDEASRVRFELPAGWVQDLEYGKESLNPYPGQTVLYFAGKPIVGEYDPVIHVNSYTSFSPTKDLVPNNKDLKKYIDLQTDHISEAGFKVTRRYSSSLAGSSTEVVIIDMSGVTGLKSDSMAQQIYLIKGQMLYIITCSFVDGGAAAFELCTDVVRTLEFY